MINLEILVKTDRHDRSITETEKKQFRSSPTWQRHREAVADSQNWKDYITGEPLLDDFNCHHVVMINSEYKNLTNPFFALNKETHKRVHEAFSKYFDDPAAWSVFKTKYGTSPAMTRFYEVIDTMIRLNDDIEPVLYQNNYDYTLVNPADKYTNKLLAERVRYPINNTGYLQWNSNYIPASYPQDTYAWYEYMKSFNNEVDYLLILELRHMNLYSSYKNFRKNPKIRQETKRQCRIELEKVTKLLRNFA